MVAKCSNPSCSALFRRLAEGRLFRLEPDPTLPGSSKSNRVEYFWLCGSCSAAMTLHVGGEGKVIPIALPAPVHGGPHRTDLISSTRPKRLLLYGVGFSTERHRTGARSVGGWRRHHAR